MKKNIFCLPILCITIIWHSTSCKKTDSPILSTLDIQSVTNISAIGGGNITNSGGSIITQRGICWSTNPNPTKDGNHTNDGSGTGIYTSNLTGLTANTTYYVRAYATNSSTTAYGNQLIFNTTGGSNGIMGIRGLYQGSDVVIPSGKTVTGIVISDNTGANFDTKNLVIQDTNGGIVIRFTAVHSYLVGDQVTVDLSGLTLTSYYGLAEVINVPASAASKTGTGTITPRVATCADIQTNATAWQSTLLTVQNATIGGSGTTYSGNKTLTDVTGTLNHHTKTTATFAATTRTSGSKSYTGVLGCYLTPSLSIRTLNDVQ